VKKLRVNEIYQTFAGEGPHVGEMTTFIRFGGCNLRCPGWGVKTELPGGEMVVGCDTPHAVFPELYKDDPKMTAREIMEKVPKFPLRVTITGGEPFMQPTEELRMLLYCLIDEDHSIDIFTNGTLPYDSYADLLALPQVSLCVDYKMPGSGEFGKFRNSNLDFLDSDDEIKFVIKDENDYITAKSILEKIVSTRPDLSFSIGPVWGEIEPGDIVGWILRDKLEVKLNLQTHQLIGVNEAERDWHFE